MHKSNEHCNCKCTSTCTQTFDDMDFERGIWYAAQYGDIERVRRLAERGVDLKDNSGYTALHYAARTDHYDVCKLLLQLGASVNIQTRAAQATPLHRAATSGKVRIVELLLASGADPTVKDADGQTPLHRAAVEGHKEIVKALIAKNDKCLLERDNRNRLPVDLAKSSSLSNDISFITLFQ